MPRLQARGRPRISSKTAIIIGATIGAIYIIIILILIHIFLQRRLRKKILNEQHRVLRTANSHQSTLYLSFHDNFASPQSRGQSFPDRSRTHSEARSYQRARYYHGSARSAGTLSPIRERPKTRRRGEYHDEYEQNWTTARRDTFSSRERSDSDSTVIRSRSRSCSEHGNPFWMFDGTYTDSMRSSLRSPRRHSYSTISTIRARDRKPSGLMMPTDVFISEMNEKYPEASIRPTPSSKSMALIRQVSHSPTPSLYRPPSRSPSQKVLQEIQENDESFLPEVPLDPLIRKKSIERIVSGHFPQPKLVEIGGQAKGKANGAEVVRIGTVKRVRELVDVSLNGVGQRGHGRNKSLSAFNDLFSSFVGRRKSRASGETERSGREREIVDIRSSIETMSEKMSEKAW